MAYAPAPPAPKEKQHRAWVSPSSALASQLHLPAALGTKDSGGQEEEEQEGDEEEGQIGVEVLRSASPNPNPPPPPHPYPNRCGGQVHGTFEGPTLTLTQLSP